MLMEDFDIQKQAQDMTKNITDSSLAVQPKKPDVTQDETEEVPAGSTQDVLQNEIPEKTELESQVGIEPQGSVDETSIDKQPEDVVDVYKTGDTIPYIGGTGTFGKDYSDAEVGNNGYIYNKFRKVKPYTIQYKGRSAEVDTLNIKKAIYEMNAFYGAAEDPRVSYYGYDKLPEIEKDSVPQAILMGVWNMIPSISAQAVGGVAVELGHMGETVGQLFDNKEIVEASSDLIKDVREITDGFVEATTFRTDEFGRGRNELAEGVGNVAISMAAILIGKNPQIAMAVLEGLSAAYQADAELSKRGVNGFSALALSGLAGAGTYAIGSSSIAFQKFAKASLAPSTGWVKLMKENPGAFFARLGVEGGLEELYEAATEVGQDAFTQYIGKGYLDEDDREGLLNTFIASLIVGGGLSAYRTYNGRQTLQDHVDKISAIAEKYRAPFEELTKKPNSPFTMDMFNALVDRFKEGRSIPELAEIIKTQALGNVDRVFGDNVTPEFKAKFKETVEKLSTDGALIKVLDKVDNHIDSILGSVYGDGSLTQSQKDMFRIMMRGIAINQLVYRGLTPDQWMNDAGVYLAANKNMKTPSGVVRLGSAEKTGEGRVAVQLNTNKGLVNRSQASMVYNGAGQASARLTKNQVISQDVGRKAKDLIKSKKGKTNLSGTIGAGSMRHEMAHVMSMFTGLSNVPEFVDIMKKWTETVLPGISSKGGDGKSVEEQEVLARAFEFAQSILEPLGLEGQTADYMNLLLSVAQANSYVKGFRNYLDMFSKVAKRNDEIIKDVLQSYSPDDVAAFENFCETGKNETLDTKTLTAIHNALTQGMTTEGANAIKEKIGDVDFVKFDKNYRDYIGEQKESYKKAITRDQSIALATESLISSKTGDSTGNVNILEIMKSQEDVIDQEVAKIKEEKEEKEEKEKSKDEASSKETKSEEKPVKTEEKEKELPVVPTAEEAQAEQEAKKIEETEELSDWEKNLNRYIENNEQDVLTRLVAAEEGFDLDSKIGRYGATEVESIREVLKKTIDEDKANWEIYRRPDKNDNGRIVAVARGITDLSKSLEKSFRKNYGDAIADRILTSVAHSVILKTKNIVKDINKVFDDIAVTTVSDVFDEAIKNIKEDANKPEDVKNKEIKSLEYVRWLTKRAGDINVNVTEIYNNAYSAMFEESRDFAMGFGEFWRTKQDKQKGSGSEEVAREKNYSSYENLFGAELKDFYLLKGSFKKVLDTNKEVMANQALTDIIKQYYNDISEAISVIRGTTFAAYSDQIKDKMQEKMEKEAFINDLSLGAGLTYVTKDGELLKLEDAPIVAQFGRKSTQYYNQYMYKNIMRHYEFASSLTSSDLWDPLSKYVESGIEYFINKEETEVDDFYDSIKPEIYISVGSKSSDVMRLYTEDGVFDVNAISAAREYMERTKTATAGYTLSPNIFAALVADGIRKTRKSALESLQKRFPKMYEKYSDSVRLYIATRDIDAVFSVNNAEVLNALTSKDESGSMVSTTVINDKAWMERQDKQEKNWFKKGVEDLFAEGKPKYDYQTDLNLIQARINKKTGIAEGGVRIGSRLALVHRNGVRELSVIGHFVDLNNAYVEGDKIHGVGEAITAVYADKHGNPVSVNFTIEDLNYMLRNGMPIFLGEGMSGEEIVKMVKWAKGDSYVGNLMLGVETSGSLYFDEREGQVEYDPFENVGEVDDIVDLNDFFKPLPGNPDMYTIDVMGDTETISAVLPSSTVNQLKAAWSKGNVGEMPNAMKILAGTINTLKENKNYVRETKGVPVMKEFLDSRLGGGKMTVREFLKDGNTNLKKTKTEGKTWLNKFLYFVTRSVGFGNKARNLYGSEFAQKLGIDVMSNKVAQATQEFKRAVQEHLVNKVFDGNLNKMVVWLKKTSTDINDTKVKLKDGRERDISRQEIMTLYLAKLLSAEEKVRAEKSRTANGEDVYLVNPANGGAIGVMSQLADVIGSEQINNLIKDHLTDVDKKAVEAVLKSATMYASTGEEDAQYFYIPVTTLESLFKGSWGNRAENGYMAFGKNITENEIYPMGLYDAIMKMAAHNALKGNNFISALKTIKTLFDLGTKYKMETIPDGASAINEATKIAMEEGFKKQFKILGFEENEIGSLEENAKLLLETIKEANEMRARIEEIIGSANFEALMKELEYEANSEEHKLMAMSAAAKVVDKMTHSVMSGMLFGKAKSMIFNFAGNYAIFNGLSQSGGLKYMTVDFVNALSKLSSAGEWKRLMTKGFLSNRLKSAGMSDEFERLSDMTRDTIITDITNYIDKHKHEKVADFMRGFEAWSKKLTKYGVGISSALPDVLGIATAYESVIDNVQKMASESVKGSGLYNDQVPEVLQGIIERTADEMFENYMLQHISNSSYMTRGLVQKQLAKMGLVSVVAFTNDQLLKGAQLANIVKEYINTDDEAKKHMLMNEMKGILNSSGIYIAVQAMLFTTLARAAFGDGLDENEEKELYRSLIRETLGQLLGFFQYGNLLQDAVVGGVLGGQGGLNTIPLAQLELALSKGVQGKALGATQEVTSLIGIPWFKRLTELVAANVQLVKDSERTADDWGVYGARMLGYTEGSALKKRNLRKTDSGDYKKVKPKKKKDKGDE